MSSACPPRTRRLCFGVLSGAMVLAVAACTGSPTTSGASRSAGADVTLIKPGKLLVCTHLPYRPFQFKDEAGTVVGFDVDLVNLVAQKLGVEQEIIDTEFTQIPSGAEFTAKKCDMGAAATSITDDRKKTVLFSDPYFTASQALLVKKDSGIKDLPDLRGKRVGVQADTTGQTFAAEHKDADGYSITVFDDMPTQLAGVVAGRVEGAINDNGVVLDYAKANPTTEVVKEFGTNEEYGFMFPKNNANGTALAKVVNETLASAKKDGSYNKIYQKWFGVDAPQ